MAKHFLLIFAIACVSVLNLRAEDADAKGETKKAIATTPASPVNGAVINYQPVLSGVLNMDYAKKSLKN
ncbi:MAG: hypothetical protein C0582_02670 [Alphaproteobacteria bacterium]|nr:MAG: hypothetical protein C0582_02670 [Alphaproteobacteria bacterium]